MPRRITKPSPGLVRQTLEGWEWECRSPRCGSAGRYFGSEFVAASALVTHERRSHGTEPSQELLPPAPAWSPVDAPDSVAAALSAVWAHEFEELMASQRRLVIQDATYMINTEMWADLAMAARELRRRIFSGNLARYAAVLHASTDHSPDQELSR